MAMRSIGGGTANQAIGEGSLVSGVLVNRASGLDVSVGDGQASEADSDVSFVSGARNKATASQEVPVNVGFDNKPVAKGASASDGSENDARGEQSSACRQMCYDCHKLKQLVAVLFVSTVQP